MTMTYEGDWYAATSGGAAPSTAPGGESSLVARARAAALSDRGRYGLALAPIVAIFLLGEWLLLTDRVSFSWLLGLLGTVTASLIVGLFPGPLLLSSRRKGELLPDLVIPFLGWPLVIWGVYALFLANLFLHGLVIWDGPFERAGALLVGLVVVVATIRMVRLGAFARRMVVELRQDGGDRDRSVLSVLAAGRPAEADVGLGYEDGREERAAVGEVPSFAGLRSATIRLPATRAKELKVWVHRVTPDGDSESMPARLEVHDDGERTDVDLSLSAGQAILPLGADTPRLRITFPERERT